MRLKSIFISDYKNLKKFKLSFDSASFIDLFVGKNGSGKSNLFEALVEIFRHLDQFGRLNNEIAFDYRVSYEIDGQVTEIEWKAGKLRINQDEDRKTLGQTPFPKNVVVYYSGHNPTVAGLVNRYEKAFRRRIYRGIKSDESRLFIGVGSEYKAIFLAALLSQSEDSKASKYIKVRLGIASVGAELQVTLKQPFNAKSRLKVFDADEFDPLRSETRYWGADKITQEFIDNLVNCIKSKDGFNIAELYDRRQKRYCLNVNLELFRQRFRGVDVTEIFRQFDNLKTLGMLADVALPLNLVSGKDGNVAHFSDGQFQSVYIYSVVEIFKDRNCLILLDEPDAFLHPEWQFYFLRQVSDLNDAAAKRTGHVLMSSHSASTITCANESVINLFEFDGEKVVLTKVNKADIIKSLSAGLITFSESEARLSINHFLRSTSGDVLFTEGVTDEKILETAWLKLYPDEPCPFAIQNAFDRIFPRNLFSRDELRVNFPDRRMFALFDFDEAYDDWNGLDSKKCVAEVIDPNKGLVKRLQHKNHYALLLPVPNVEAVKRQVLDDTGKPWGRGQDSHLSIELLFFKDEWVGTWFQRKAASAGAQIIEFSGDKAKFANDVVPTLDQTHFEPFKPVFEFIKSKCAGGAPA
ncbi:MAG: AAA family ATPase [Rhodoferax sp.]|nr:AAA family ATPase [Rhodoferax sp.]